MPKKVLLFAIWITLIPGQLLIVNSAIAENRLFAQRAPVPQQFLPQRKKGKGNEQAVASVKSKFPGRRILSINKDEKRGPGTYRVKTLSKSGVVKYVYVDAGTGDVVE